MGENQVSDGAPPDSDNPHKRAKPRYAANLRVELFTKGFNHHLVERTANISSGGLFVCTGLASEVGEKMHIRIIFADRNAFFDVKAKVVWVCNGASGHPKGLGVEFIELNQAQQDVINRHLVEYVNVRDR